MKADCALLLVPLLFVTGCPMCGVGPVPTHADGGSSVATVDTSGDVVFAQELIGVMVSFDVPLRESAAGQGETVESASIEGSGKASFAIRSSFPIELPANEEATLTVQFSPATEGELDAQIDLQTQKMGVSTFRLTGTGVTPAQ